MRAGKLPFAARGRLIGSDTGPTQMPELPRPMKNIQIIDGAENSVYDIFQATEDEFAVIFPDGANVAFSDEIFDRGDEQSLIALFTNIWKRRIKERCSRYTRNHLLRTA
jgi:hypothetical protein